MRGLVRWILLSVVAPAVALGAGEVEVVPDHADSEMTVIGITPRKLFSSVEIIDAEDSFGWINYSNTEVSITFDDPDIVSKMRCRSRDPFRVEARHLSAPRIPAGGFATLCQLARGEYTYRVTLADTSASLVGKLVVE